MSSSSREYPITKCDHEDGCDQTFKDSGYWAHIDTDKQGWFFMKDGRSFCPEHTPEWVAAWRAKRANS